MNVFFVLFNAVMYYLANVFSFYILESPSIGMYFLFNLFRFLLYHLVISLLAIQFKNIKKMSIDVPVLWVTALVIVVMANAVTIVISQSGNEFRLFEILVVLMLAIICFVFFHLYNTISSAYEDKLVSVVYSQEKEYYFLQCQMMQESVEKMKSFRHDVSTHLVALLDYTTNGKADDAANYISTLIGQVDKGKIYSETGNIAFDSIINYKLRNTAELNIKPEIKILLPSVLNIEVADVVTILGNLLDNALDAVVRTDEKIIKLDIEFTKGNLFIRVENSYNSAIMYSNENTLNEDVESERNISSLKNSDEHGYGLKNISKSLEKYNGYMKIIHTDKNFSVIIFLYL